MESTKHLLGLSFRCARPLVAESGHSEGAEEGPNLLGLASAGEYALEV
jgi:hypothetical protein